MIIGVDAKTLGKRKTGIAFYVQNVLKYLNENDEKNTYILYTNRELDIPFELKSNFRVEYYKAKIASIAIYRKLPKLLKRDKVDLFWGPEHILPKKSKSYKSVVTIHDLAFAKIKGICTYNNIIIQGLFAKRSCRNADKIIAISRSTKRDIVDLYKIDERKIEVVYNGESGYTWSEALKGTDKFKSCCDKFRINGRYLLFVGAIEPRKNIANMVRAFDAYKEKSGSDIKFVIAGGSGWKTQPIYEAINSAKYRTDIILTGYISGEEKEMLYRNATALMFVSLYEGFGLPVIEALSVGVPVITSNVSSLPEAGGDCCYYVRDPRNEKEIADVLERAMSDIEAGATDVSALIAQADKFHISNCARETLKIFNSFGN